jgi:23S rRNA (guanosine2251-2'-O)-methyltransferase
VRDPAGVSGAVSAPEGRGDRTPEEGPVLAEPLPVVAVLDNVRSAFNVGSIFRTSEAARVRELLLCGITPYPPHPQLDRTGLGTVDRVRWRHLVSTVEAVRELRGSGIPVWAVEVAEGARSLRAVTFPRPVAVIFGHETAGIGTDILRQVDGVVEIPLYGRKNSLNVASAYAVVVFEILRQWGY